MADLSDVVDALGTLCQGALYPGQDAPAGNAVAGIPVLVQAGWPDPASLVQLVKDAAAVPPNVRVMVTIYPRPTERNTTRYSEDYGMFVVPPATYTLTIVGQTVAVGGAPQTAPFSTQNLAVGINGQPFAIQAAGGESTDALAAALQAAIIAVIPGATLAGSVISLPGTARLQWARVGGIGTAIRETKRQERQFQIVVWAPTPALRDGVAKVIDPVLGAATFLTLADGTAGRLRYAGSPFSDFDQKQGIYRRDLLYTVEYGTTDIIAADQIVQTELVLKPTYDGVHAVDSITLHD